MKNLSLAGVLIFVGACAVRPIGEPSIVGVITQVSSDRILVEENPADTAGSAKASVRITDQTDLVLAAGPAATKSDLRAGAHVRVWFRGPVMESYPVQAAAARIEILN